jgi:hypothetical protein
MGLAEIPPIAAKNNKCLAQFGVKRDCPFWQDGVRSMVYMDKINVCAWRPFSGMQPRCENKMAEQKSILVH